MTTMEAVFGDVYKILGQTSTRLQLKIALCPPIDNQLTLITMAATVVDVRAGATRNEKYKS